MKVDTDFTRKKGITDMYTDKLMWKILSTDNLNQAIKQVRKNKGKPGVDGMTVDEVKMYFVRHESELRKQIRQRTYKPEPVLRVEIPKPNGGVRLLGIPTVVDRVIQQAIAQVIGPIFDKQFSEYSYGFRPRKRAEMAIRQALEFMNDGYQWIVDIDLERFFDTVNHDRLMNLVSNSIKDGDVISLIRKYLVSGISTDEGFIESPIGTPQGGNLSPLLSNIMLHELDKELHSRNLRFVRYADDCIIFVKSEMAARRVMRNIVHFIEEKLGLIVNAEKSKIIRPNDPDFKFLGFGFYWDWQEKNYQPKPHAISVNNFRKKIKDLTKRNWGVSTSYRIEKLNEKIRGWVNYFRMTKMKTVLEKIDSNLRVRLRMCIWKQWKTPKNRRKHLRKLGMSKNDAYKNSYSSKSIARIAYSWVLTTTLTNEQIASQGLLFARSYYQTKHVM
ncbi:group II intron reverse transcriptase/maturase [Enterococcus sp.]|uniref:group II intron reverse transcriptase/maturase n=1 Tax=Enterococcus sp. TaxID=35783 RepID=UPI0039778664